MSVLLPVRDLAGLPADERRRLLEREGQRDEARDAVRPIVEDVRARGDDAVRAWTRRFDGADRADLEVAPAEFRAARRAVAPAVVRALRASAAAVRKVSAATRPRARTVAPVPGVRVREEWKPMRRAGCYAPGGRAAYPSTVVMTVVPAVEAGVEETVVASPPRRDGTLPPELLVAAEVAGASRVFAMGGAQAVAALAYGTASVPRVDVLVGPGNAYVTAAKFLVSDAVAIDSLAGPSELLLLADDSAPAAWVVLDLLAQAEHAPDARALLVTTSRRLAEAVARGLAEATASSPRRDVLEPALRDHGALLVARSPAEAFAFAEAYAAEHLQVMMRGAARLAPRFRTAGTVFVGAHATASFGDYATGANHTLPTGGAARFQSVLGVQTFLRRTFTQSVSAAGARRLAGVAETLGRAEGLVAHAEAARARARPAAGGGSRA